MAFGLPNFNLHVNIWYNQGNVNPPVGAPDATFMGQLRALFTANGVAAISTHEPFIILCCPHGTNVVGPAGFGSFTAPHGDIVEVPAGTGRYYRVFAVDDVARGFGNEYRFCVLRQNATAGRPIP